MKYTRNQMFSQQDVFDLDKAMIHEYQQKDSIYF